MRTLGLVALASAAAVLAVAKDSDADASRVIQGVITGVGFLGAGVILHRATGRQVVHGLSTAATIWITASLGVFCGLAAWSIWIIAVVLTAFLLFVGGMIEKRSYGRRNKAIAPFENLDISVVPALHHNFTRRRYEDKAKVVPAGRQR